MRMQFRASSWALFLLFVIALGARAQQPSATDVFRPVPGAPAAVQTAPSPAATSLPGTTTPATRTTRPVYRIVAVVNDEVITANELRALTLSAIAQLERQKI
ncbi:MAG TPA: hypothetical protein VLN25_02425 [Burkholderiaceae bacterium]|nr:hypothetical protein [Burkholderiaceae bacterium]